MSAIHVLPVGDGKWVVKDRSGRELSRHKKRAAAESVGRKAAAWRRSELLIFNDFNELERRSRPRRRSIRAAT